MEYKRGDVYTVLFNYYADKVEFNKGDKVEMIKTDDGCYAKVKHKATNIKGSVPKNYLALEGSIESEDWFFGNLSKQRAISLLMSPENPPGTFLVRSSETVPLRFTISVKQNSTDAVKHIRIIPYGEQSFLLDGSQKRFTSLQKLVEHYKNEGLKNGPNTILHLLKPLPKLAPLVYNPQYENHNTDIWKLPHEQLTVCDKIGGGQFGVVYKGFWRYRIKVAIKRMRHNSISSWEDFKHEASIMKSLQHPHVISLYGICTEDDIMIVTEFMEKGSLLHVLKSEGKHLRKDLLYKFAQQIADGMKYLEAKNYVHRDLAARNVLVDDNYNIKISDFGLSRVLKYDMYKSQKGICSVKWTAPEALDDLFTIKSDVWSYGIVLYEIFSLGEEPYGDLSDCEELKRNYRKGYRLAKPVHATQDVYKLMVKCWSFNKDDRPYFRDICNSVTSIILEEKICY